ncbi:DUF3784 domain-containing protein [Halorussus halobius]|uniref:DUF3784 domain-containing protein n=1 Tax=Halorussus halobius TaxID=1710537 RepID=UPI001091D073|nr:DUF3784 domain-containing protein [Halorussus halobius]
MSNGAAFLGAQALVPLQIFGDSFPTTTFGLGVALLVFGYLIRVYHMTGLIAGINPEMVRDEDRLANLVGGTLFLMSALTFVYGFLLMQNLGGDTLQTVYELTLVGMLVVMFVKARTV